MIVNRLKRHLRRRLPPPMLNAIQWLRTLAYRPPKILEELRAQHETMNRQLASTGTMALREGIVLRIDEESRFPFEWFCWRSPEMVRELDVFVQRTKEVSTFADVGCNHGIFSLVFLSLNPNGKVLSIDPSPIAAEIFRRNRELNQLDNAIRHHQVACGSSPGTVQMHYNWHHLEASSQQCVTNNDVTIRVETLDDICKREELIPDVVKIDVEGFELDVLKGAEKSLSQAKLLFLEVHPPRLDELGISQPAIFDWLSTHNWTVKSLQGELFSASKFNDRIHTFWTICERETRLQK